MSPKNQYKNLAELAKIKQTIDSKPNSRRIQWHNILMDFPDRLARRQQPTRVYQIPKEMHIDIYTIWIQLIAVDARCGPIYLV